MSYNEAMEIQTRQLAWYRHSIGRKGVKQIRHKTRCPADLDPNKPIFIGIINELVPRGGYFEQIHFGKGTQDPNALSWYDAMKSGKIYS